ncbi:MAG: hypothetical protein C3F13_19320 [Anaerolineales bacterium]|nr:MAG: hypothetical protein C3F13_19320 [Anaerolineales bacterium]
MPIIVVLLGVISTSYSPANGQNAQGDDKPPEVIQGGSWKDDFWQGKLEQSENIDVQLSFLLLKYTEQLHWKQTWKEHFAEGEFWQTEAISDSVRLAWDEDGQEFYSAGIYTSTVFYAGRAVDWVFSEWKYSGTPEGVFIQFRTGETQNPDDGWSGWMVPRMGNFEYLCAYTLPSGNTDCFTNLNGINSSPYIQYRASFKSDHPSTTVELYDIDFLYGIHCLSGSALSIPIPPADLREWESVLISSTVPADTTLVIDVVTTDGTVLIPDAMNGTSLKGIDPHDHPVIQLRASLTTTDASVSPGIDVWGLKWIIWHRQFIPIAGR